MPLSMTVYGRQMGTIVVCAAILSCSGDPPTVSRRDRPDNVKEDTATIVRFAFFDFTVRQNVENIGSVIDIEWGVVIYPSSGRDLRMVHYELRNDRDVLLHSRDDPFPEFLHVGDTLFDAESSIPFSQSSSAVTFHFRVSYETGHLLSDTEDRERWQGPLGKGSIDTAFVITP